MEADECVSVVGGSDAFWKSTDAAYARTQSKGNGFLLTQPAHLAADIALPACASQQCLDSGRDTARGQDLADGVRIGATGTPTTILRHSRTAMCG